MTHGQARWDVVGVVFIWLAGAEVQVADARIEEDVAAMVHGLLIRVGEHGSRDTTHHDRDQVDSRGNDGQRHVAIHGFGVDTRGGGSRSSGDSRCSGDRRGCSSGSEMSTNGICNGLSATGER